MTSTKINTLQEELEKANPNTLADALKMAGIARQLAPIKVTFAGLSASATLDVTSAAARAAATIVGATLEPTERLPPVGDVVACRVTGGAAAAGLRQIGDVGATPSATVATLSDDGKILEFEDTVTDLVLYYRPRSANPIDTTQFSNEV